MVPLRGVRPRLVVVFAPLLRSASSYAGSILRLTCILTVLSSGVPNECAYFLGLGPECVELIAPICCLQLHSLGKVLRVNQLFARSKLESMLR